MDIDFDLAKLPDDALAAIAHCTAKHAPSAPRFLGAVDTAMRNEQHRRLEDRRGEATRPVQLALPDLAGDDLVAALQEAYFFQQALAGQQAKASVDFFRAIGCALVEHAFHERDEVAMAECYELMAAKVAFALEHQRATKH